MFFLGTKSLHTKQHDGKDIIDGATKRYEKGAHKLFCRLYLSPIQHGEFMCIRMVNRIMVCDDEKRVWNTMLHIS